MRGVSDITCSYKTITDSALVPMWFALVNAFYKGTGRLQTVYII